MRNRLPLVLVSLLFGVLLSPLAEGCSSSDPLDPQRFLEPAMGYRAETEALRAPVWDDGNAEVARYHAEQPFYGAMREGEAILLTVKESFDMDALVKADGDVPHAHVAEVIKLNEVLTFQTGVYTYRQMASAFVTRDTMGPLKLVLSSQEWCGITTKIVTVRGDDALLRTFSYFGDEAERAETLALDDMTVFADALPLFIRTLDFEYERPRTIHLIEAQLSNRAKPAASVEATLTIDGEERLLVPAGSYRTRAITVRRGDAVDVFHLDVEPPYPLIRWDRADGGTYALTLLTRAPYWSMHDPENLGDLQPLTAADPTDEAAAIVTLSIAMTHAGALSVDGDAVTLEALRDRLTNLLGTGVEIHATFDHPGASGALVDQLMLELSRHQVTLIVDDDRAAMR